MSLWRNLFRKARVERELDDELRSYIDLLIAEKIRAGMTPAAARRAALIESGGPEQVKEQVRDVRSGMFLDTLWRDLRYGVRALARSRGFTVTAVLALALGIGATTSIFSVIYALLLKPLPFPSGDRLMFVHMNFSPQNMPLGPLSVADYLDWKAANHVFEDLAAFRNNRFDLTGAGEPEQVEGVIVTAGFFSTLEVQPLLGRLFQPGEDGPGSRKLVVLSESLWRRRFGASINAIGGAVELNGSRYTVIGVMPASFRFSDHPKELWANLPWKPPTRRGPFNLTGLARLKRGVTREQAQAETNAIGRHIEQANAGTYQHLGLPMVPMREAVSGDIRPGLLVMFGAVLLVLLIAIVNVANLLLARATTREREMAIRLSLGAGRSRLLRQLLTESLLLALAGGIAGILLASWGIAVLEWWGLDKFPRARVDIGIDGHVLLFTCLLSLVSGVLLGLAPAWTGARTSLNASLREGGPSGGAGRANQRLRAALVVCEIALSLVLLVGAGLLLRSFLLFQRVNPGFTAPPEHVLTMHISPNRVKYDDDEKSIAFQQRMLESLARLPGVEAVGVSDSLPPDDISDADTFVIEGQVFDRGQLNPAVTNSPVSPDYFRALGIPLLRGRYFDGRDTARSAPVVVISESLARRYFAGQDPIGRRLKPSGPELTNIPYSEIVGVVGDVIYCGPARRCEAAYYQPFTQNVSTGTNVVVRSALPPASLLPSLRRAIHAVDADVVVNDEKTLERAMAESMALPRVRVTLLGIFAAAALLLAAIGIYGVMSYTVAQRTHEIGLRVALGAQPSDVLRLIAGQGTALALSGIGLGLAGAVALTRLMQRMLFGVTPTDPATFCAVPLVLLAVALAAGLLPARRAARIDPTVALRHE